MVLSFTVLYAELNIKDLASSLLRDTQSIFKQTVDDLAQYSRDNYDKQSRQPSTPQKGKRLKFPINFYTLLSTSNCNQVVSTDAFTACYDYSTKISKIVVYDLKGDDLRSGYIDRKSGNTRLFYSDSKIPKRYRAFPSDYTRSNQDRGHIRSYASSAYSQQLIDETYSMVNIVPQTPELNRKRWIKAEKYERVLAKKLGSVTVINISRIPNKGLKRIGKHGIGVPVGFYKIILESDGRDGTFKRCLYYENSKKKIAKDKLKHHVVDCNKIYY